MTLTGIYKIHSIKFPKRIYIGSAKNFKNRKHGHITALRRGNHCNKKIQRHFNKYGEKDLVFTFILECKQSELLANEQYYIDTLNPWFNILKVAGSNLGKKLSEDTKMKISKANKGRQCSEEERLRLSLMQKGKKASEETRKKQSEGIRLAWTKRERKPISEETRQKMRTAALSRGAKPPIRKGCKLSEETKEKMKGRNPWNKGKPLGFIPKGAFKKGENCGEQNHFFGKHHSEETKVMISIKCRERKQRQSA